jgi:hypothetical protein
MLVRLIRPPKHLVHPTTYAQWQVGQTYDLPPRLALALILDDCAHVEMRSGRDRRQRRRPFAHERRRVRPS